MKQYFSNLNEDFDELEKLVENLDNSQWRNNIKISGLKEGAEGEDCF